MKLPCELVQDLLPLYHDGVCSQVSKENVEAHLAGCETCRGMLSGIEREIEVPETEKNAAKGLRSIKKQWKKSRLLSFLTGFALTAAIVAAAWWLLFGWYCIPIDPEEIYIGQRCVMENGLVVLERGVPYPSYYPHDYVTEDGIRYSWFTRPIFWDKIDSFGTSTSYWDPEEDYWIATDSREKVAPVAWYIGKPDSGDLVLYWSKDMELPPAGEEVEQRYQQLQEQAFNLDVWEVVVEPGEPDSTDPTWAPAE